MQAAQGFQASRAVFKDEPDIDFEDWEDDKGFWSRVLKQNRKISLLSIRTEHLEVCNKWTYVDRVRLVYLCIIQGYLIAKDDRVSIPLEYIRLVMDFGKMRMFPWGLHAYDELIDSIRKATKDLHLKNSYVLDGFSIAFQIWVMEAIPDIGTMVGQKFNKNITKVRCRNWKGSGKVSYEDISSLESHFDKIWVMEAIPDIGTMVGQKFNKNITKVRCRNWKGSGKVSYEDISSLESHFDKGELFPFISASGNSNLIDSDQFFREDEKNDERVGRIVALINAKQDWSEFEWEVQALPRNVELFDSEEGVDVGDVTETSARTRQPQSSSAQRTYQTVLSDLPTL
ncbi:hypothetical protein F2Q69_00037291 [Brassica cretica]|uniref:DUF1985 domain-containing protein n=1 Tax=Brassica cretica TaxID=69181 RepID=A0A8S9SJ86_BRACR|nr:hypothetical protein F2Q69_00037291 [Brassica cretica]